LKILKYNHIISKLLYFYLFTGTFPSLIVDILGVIENTKDISKHLDWIFLVLFPNYNLSKGLAKLYNNYDFLDLCFNIKPKDVYGKEPGKDSLLEICDLLGDDLEDACCKGKSMKFIIKFNKIFRLCDDTNTNRY